MAGMRNTNMSIYIKPQDYTRLHRRKKMTETNENKQSCDNLCNLVVRKRKMLKDERGQWIISAGFLVSVSIIILALLLNQAMMGGYQSSGAILEFPKHEIRELVQETHREVNIAAEKAWEMNGGENITAINLTFRKMMLNYTNSVEYLYASHGQMVYMNISSVSFNACTFDPELIEIPVVPEQVLGPFTETLYADNLNCTGCGGIINGTNATDALDNVSATVFNVSDGGTVNATISNHTVGSGDILSVNFGIRLRRAGTWNNDEINISYYNGSTWSHSVDPFKPSDSLTWYGNYPAANVTTWGEVDNMTIRITGKKKGAAADNGNLSIDAYHVHVKYQP
jgi:hypothetical protein